MITMETIVMRNESGLLRQDGDLSAAAAAGANA
jgi:hypothetical protein